MLTEDPEFFQDKVTDLYQAVCSNLAVIFCGGRRSRVQTPLILFKLHSRI